MCRKPKKLMIDPRSAHSPRSSQSAFSDRPSLSSHSRRVPSAVSSIGTGASQAPLSFLQLASSLTGFAGLSPASFPEGKDLGSWL